VNIVAWRGFPIADSVAELTGLPVRLGGDGLCMAMGEHRHGAGRGAQFMLGMVVSTGIGGGLVLDGAPYDGRTGNAGHVGMWWWTSMVSVARAAGGVCAETVGSGPAMTRWARGRGWGGADAKELAGRQRPGTRLPSRRFGAGRPRWRR
jgi:glucokinase